MNKNTAIGLGLIALILIGWSAYNNKLIKQQQEHKRIQDSISHSHQIEYAKELAERRADSLSKNYALASEEVNRRDEKAGSMFISKNLEEAYRSETQYYTLENDNLKVVFSSRGAQPYSIQVKDFYTYDSLDLMFIKEKASNLSLEFFTNQSISTGDFNFNKVSQTDSSIIFELNFTEVASIMFSYTLPKNEYKFDFDITMMGMDNIIQKRISQIDLKWKMDVPRLEKGYDNEKNYSTIVYKYPRENSVEKLGLRKESSSSSIKTKVSWFAFQQQFFSGILVAKNEFASGDLGFKFYPEDDPKRNLMACSAAMQIEYTGENYVNIPMEFYFGPNLYKTLKSYGQDFEKLIPLGGWLIGWINRGFIIPVFDFLNRYIANFGIIILIMTLLIKLIISPLTLKSYMSSAKMRVIKPEVDKINERYPKPDDAMKKQQATMDLYKKSGVSMMGGCVPMLIQFPILIAMFRFFPASFELRQEGFLWAKDLSAYDSILDLPFSIPLYGDHISLFALLMAVSMHFYARMNMDQMNAGNQTMPGMKGMQLWFMPIFLLVICNNFSSGLSYYYMLSNVITMLQTWVIRKWFVDEDKILAKIKQKSAEPVKKSKFQQRLDAAYKAQQQAKNKK